VRKRRTRTCLGLTKGPNREIRGQGTWTFGNCKRGTVRERYKTRPFAAAAVLNRRRHKREQRVRCISAQGKFFTLGSKGVIQGAEIKGKGKNVGEDLFPKTEGSTSAGE